MKINEDWLSEKFESRWFDEADEPAGMYYVKEITDIGDLALISSTKNGYYEVMLFPFEEIRYQNTEQIETVYKTITGKVL